VLSLPLRDCLALPSIGGCKNKKVRRIAEEALSHLVLMFLRLSSFSFFNLIENTYAYTQKTKILNKFYYNYLLKSNSKLILLI